MYSTLIFLVYATSSFVSGCKTDAKEIGVCLHTYLERDFPAIHMIVYDSQNQCRDPNSRENKLSLEGPEMANSCKHIGRVLDCFTDVLKDCYLLEDFFAYRELLESLDKVFEWVCKDPILLRARLGKLLIHYECMEKAVFEGECNRHTLPKNIWNRILRLENSTETCSDLKELYNCVITYEVLKRFNPETQYVYRNMSSIFLNRWCSGANSARPISNLIIFSLMMCLIMFVLEKYHVR